MSNGKAWQIQRGQKSGITFRRGMPPKVNAPVRRAIEELEAEGLIVVPTAQKVAMRRSESYSIVEAN